MRKAGGYVQNGVNVVHRTKEKKSRQKKGRSAVGRKGETDGKGDDSRDLLSKKKKKSGTVGRGRGILLSLQAGNFYARSLGIPFCLEENDSNNVLIRGGLCKGKQVR